MSSTNNLRQFLVAFNHEIAFFRREIGDFSCGVYRAASKLPGLNLVFTSNGNFFSEFPQDVLKAYPHLKGVIVYRDQKLSQSLVKTFQPLKIPVLIYGSSSYTSDSGTPHSVSTHEEEIVRKALEYLWEKGHRSIGLLSTHTGPAHARRAKIWKDWMNARDQEATDDMILAAPKGENSPIFKEPENVKAYADKVTATFCTDESCLALLMETFKNLGMSLPRDMSIVSVNNTLIAETVRPSVSSMHLPQDLDGALCMDQLYQVVTGSRIPIQERGQVQLVERQSVTVPRK